MNKFVKLIRNAPLLFMIVVSAIVMSAVGYVRAYMGRCDLKVTMDHPMLSSVLLEEEKTATPSDADEANAEETEEESSESTEETTEATTEASTQATTEASTEKGKDKDKNKDKNKDDKTTTEEATTEKNEGGLGGGSSQENVKVVRETQYEKVKKRTSRNSCYSDVTKRALSTDYGYNKVEKSYFDDALFIGDSRVEGLALYSGLDNAEFAYMEGLTVGGTLAEKIATLDDEKVTLETLFENKSFKKIYIMLGVNELGYNTDYFTDNYMKMIEEIQKMQPDAIIFEMSCLYVSSDYSKTHDIVNNDNIDDKNNAIAQYADGIKLFYLNVNPCVSDEKQKGLKKDYTWDDIHLQAQYYKLWEDFLYEHGIDDSMWE